MNAQPRPRVARRRTRGIRWIALAWLLFGAWPADAATLDLTGPAGAEIFVDGQARGRLPLARPLAVDVGERWLEVRLVGHVTHQESVEVTADEQDILIELDMMELSRWQAVGSSAALAGLGQLYQSRPLKGWSMMALQVGAWGWLLVADDQYKSARDDYFTALTDYENTTNRFEIVEAREAAEAAFDDVESKNDLRTYATITVIAIGAWSVYDAWRGHDRFHGPELTGSPVQTSLKHDADGTQVEVSWRWTF